ncbi:hypothetical protein Ancab_028837 [Ancistrocladus abbreviatus]
MSCNGCRVLRKGCSQSCILRPCLKWIETPEAQGHATLFVAKFFGRADLMSFISAVPHHQRPALFQSLLFEACGRTVNPVNGAVGLLCSGNWHVCQAAVQTVLSGGTLRPVPPELLSRVVTAPQPREERQQPELQPHLRESSDTFLVTETGRFANVYGRSRSPCPPSYGFNQSMICFQASDVRLFKETDGGGIGMNCLKQIREMTPFDSEASATSFGNPGVGGQKRKLLDLFV